MIIVNNITYRFLQKKNNISADEDSNKGVL